MKSLLDRKFVVISGKGGVGRTTVAAALAQAAAQRGKRVLVAQTSAAERLGALFGSREAVGPQVTALADRVWAVNMTPQEALHEYGLMVFRYEAIYHTFFENRAVRGFLRAVPGLEAYALLGKAWLHTTETEGGRPKYDLVILDGPASGHIVSMLQIPKAILDAVRRGPLIPNAQAIQDLLTDPERAAVTIVTLPEELPVRETAELAEKVRRQLRMPLGPVLVNAVPPGHLSQPPASTVLDTLGTPTGHPALDATLQVAHSLRRHHDDAEAMLSRLRENPALPLIPLPRIPEARLGPPELNRLAEALQQACA